MVVGGGGGQVGLLKTLWRTQSAACTAPTRLEAVYLNRITIFLPCRACPRDPDRPQLRDDMSFPRAERQTHPDRAHQMRRWPSLMRSPRLLYHRPVSWTALLFKHSIDEEMMIHAFCERACSADNSPRRARHAQAPRSKMYTFPFSSKKIGLSAVRYTVLRPSSIWNHQICITAGHDKPRRIRWIRPPSFKRTATAST
jgi:hypothetical protein